MVNNETYTFEFQMFYFKTDNFKQKDAELIKNCIAGSQIYQEVVFNSYGHIEFCDWDTQYRYPTVSYLETFNRNKTNCLIFDVHDDSGKYDKLFIYFNNAHNMHYGFVFYNTINGNTCHKWYLDYESAELTRKIKQTLYMFKPKQGIADAFDKLKTENKKIRKDGSLPADQMLFEQQKKFCKEKGLNILKYTL